MEYIPHLLINADQLDKAVPALELETNNSKKPDAVIVAKYLLTVCNQNSTQSFGNLNLFLCKPEFSKLNKLVRARLTKLKVEFKQFN